jgi:hypothetical protein
MRAQLHLLQETTGIDIDLPEALPLAKMRARLDIYSNITHTLWTASVGNAVAEVVSTSPDPRATLAKLANSLQHAILQAAQATPH